MDANHPWFQKPAGSPAAFPRWAIPCPTSRVALMQYPHHQPCIPVAPRPPLMQWCGGSQKLLRADRAEELPKPNPGLAPDPQRGPVEWRRFLLPGRVLPQPQASRRNFPATSPSAPMMRRYPQAGHPGWCSQARYSQEWPFCLQNPYCVPAMLLEHAARFQMHPLFWSWPSAQREQEHRSTTLQIQHAAATTAASGGHLLLA
mmetsp:Transcript_61654/g.165128  ORF Transcript_61654/g.165128 Transcript_61654/m.165128 type:complete len:202 (-) Transcript_61654:224-829(-)